MLKQFIINEKNDRKIRLEQNIKKSPYKKKLGDKGIK